VPYSLKEQPQLRSWCFRPERASKREVIQPEKQSSNCQLEGFLMCGGKPQECILREYLKGLFPGSYEPQSWIKAGIFSFPLSSYA
jgi:hypothetical protein